ncbi:FixH family protein [Marinobacter sp. BGYM27]|uniref:FixH family protein n=1 Tax=unclassified Marinobacter TaxID=83889 RepID=UPI0021A5A558|nr:FixH family protein [Marinobacter sp. BGYM27]MDG5500539.1 FixH family protein [Marinobacter sp. BGYM27]
MSEHVTETIAPWYRQFWLWFLLSIPGITIVLCIGMIYVAVVTKDPLVTDDYSKEGLGINLELARDRAAADFKLGSTVIFSGNTITLEIEKAGRPASFDYLILDLSHPTLADRDRRIQFQPVGDGLYEAKLPVKLDGRWYMELRGPENNWRLKGEAILPSDKPQVLAAAHQG